MKWQKLLVVSVLAVVAWAAADVHADGIAGLTPGLRPAGAPVVREMLKPDGWYAKALSGVSKPYPASLKFLVDQGAWFSPFLHAGMTGPYDIRGWHSGKPAAPAN